MGGRQGPDCAGGLPGRRPARGGLAPHAEAAVFFARFLFRRSAPDVEPGDSHWEHHGRAVRLSAFDWPCRVRGCGNLPAWPASDAQAAFCRANRMAFAWALVPRMCRAKLRSKLRLA